MTPTLVDTSVILDVATDDARWADRAAAALARAANEGPLVINPVIYAEVSAGYTAIEDVEDALPRQLFRRDALPWEAAFLAGRAFVSYRRRRGTRDRTLPDFFIGAHAAVAGLRLLTRDAARIRTYFPRVIVIEP